MSASPPSSRFSRWVSVLVLLGAVPVACATGTSAIPDDDDEDDPTTSGPASVGAATGPVTSSASGGGGGGAGGAGAGGASSSSSQSSSAQSSTAQGSTAQATAQASSSSGGGACDLSGDCLSCQACADQSTCFFEYDTCINSFECNDFFNCVNACMPGDQLCADDCMALYPNGAIEANDYAYCIICVGCYSDCDGAASGC